MKGQVNHYGKWGGLSGLVLLLAWQAGAWAMSFGPVTSRDSLSAIAERFYPAKADFSLEEFQQRILRANPHAFVEGDPDRLRLGVELDIPGGQAPRQRLAAAEPAVAPVASGRLDDGRYGPVAEGETLYAVARRVRPGGAAAGPLEEWVKALYEANPEAFDGGMDQLRVGAMLQVPAVALAADRPVAVPEPVIEPAPAAIAVAPEPVEEPFAEELPLIVANQESMQADDPPASLEVAAATPPALESEPQTETGPFRETELYNRARRAIADNQAERVVLALNEVESDYAGDPDFDYLQGVVLLDAGQPERALFPLLRASREQPGSLGIRLDLARAYFETGENESAREVFSGLQAQNPPPRAATVIDSYLRAIDGRAARYENRLTGQLSLGSGYDSNANSATDALVFQGFTLDERSRSTDSPYAALGGQLEFSRPLSPRFRWFGTGRASGRQFSDAEELSTVQYGLGTGLGYRRGDWQTNLRFSASQLLVDGEENSDQAAAAWSWLHTGSSFWLWRTQAQYSQVRYDQVSSRDVDQVLLAIGGTRRLNLGYGAEFGMDLIAGVDEAVETGSPNGRDLYGASLSARLQLTPRWQAGLGSHWLQSEYEGPFAGGLERSDQQWSSELTLDFADNRWRNWVLRTGLLYVDNQSDLALFEYDRLDVSLSLRRLFF